MSTATAQQLPLFGTGDHAADWRVRRSSRARRLGVRVFRDGTVEIVVPGRTGPAQVESFVARHRHWIERHRRKTLPVDLSFPPARLELLALAETWHCAGLAGDRPALAVHADAAGGGILELGVDTDAAALRAVLLDWLVERASDTLVPELTALARSVGVRLQRVQIRRQRTRWGSCSTRRTITLNCCLLFQQPAVVRYLFAHELAHLRHMNHSPQFWDLVAQYEPQWRELDRELTRGWSRVPGWLLAALRA
jgi:predicted metal-dependent hydrolase